MSNCLEQRTEQIDLVSSEMYQRIISVAIKLAGETDVRKLCSVLLNEAQLITGAQGGTLYLVAENDLGDAESLEFVILRNDFLDLDEEAVKRFPMIPLFHDDGMPNHKNVACYAYHQADRINIEDVYVANARFDFSGTRRFDEQSGFVSRSFLTVPLIAESGRVIGIFQLINSTNAQGEVSPAVGESKAS